jgi:hypothetical protein
MRMAALFLALFLPCGALSAQEAQRYALVVGNSDYGELGQLKNPVNDAADITAALRRLGFSAELLQNADLPQMEDAVVRFAEKLARDARSIGLFYYAGHGVQTQRGENYLIPVHVSIPSEAFLKTKAMLSQTVLDSMQAAGNRLNLVFLDACRNNPFGWARSTTRGLAVVGNQPPGSIIIYATSAGSVAQDGVGRNGVFTGELLKNLETPGIDLDTMLNRTAQGVMKATSNQQNPAVYKQFFETAYLRPPAQTVLPAPGGGGGAMVEVRPTGSLRIQASEPGRVFLDGTSKGDLSAGGTGVIDDVEAGSHKIEIRYASGYWGRKSLSVIAQSVNRVDFASPPKGFGSAPSTPFPIKLQAKALSPAAVSLTWVDVPDTPDAEYLVYRTPVRMSESDYPKAELVGAVPAGVQKFIDSAAKTGSYYTIDFRNADGWEFRIWVPSRNTTTQGCP